MMIQKKKGKYKKIKKWNIYFISISSLFLFLSLFLLFFLLLNQLWTFFLRYECPSCLKTLSHQKIALMKRCLLFIILPYSNISLNRYWRWTLLVDWFSFSLIHSYIYIIKMWARFVYELLQSIHETRSQVFCLQHNLQRVWHYRNGKWR